jgi:hypothetical protein
LCTTADVLTIENSRSGDEMIAALAAYGYSRDLGEPLQPELLRYCLFTMVSAVAAAGPHRQSSC